MRTADDKSGTNRTPHCKESPLPIDVAAEEKDMYKGQWGVYSLKKHGVVPLAGGSDQRKEAKESNR